MTSMPHLPAVGWDWRGQMASADLGGGGEVYFAYDASGQRVRKVWEHSGLVEERIYVGGWEVYRKRDASGLALERETLHVMDGVKRVALVETTTADASAGGAFQVATVTRFQLGNHLGSAVLEVDAAGSVISYEEYHPYGTTAYHAGTGAAEVSLKRYRYTGKERDEETGLYYHGARYYAPWLGRWTSADPMGMVDGLNSVWVCEGEPRQLCRSERDRRMYSRRDIPRCGDCQVAWSYRVAALKEAIAKAFGTADTSPVVDFQKKLDTWIGQRVDSLKCYHRAEEAESWSIRGRSSRMKPSQTSFSRSTRLRVQRTPWTLHSPQESLMAARSSCWPTWSRMRQARMVPTRKRQSRTPT